MTSLSLSRSAHHPSSRTVVTQSSLWCPPCSRR